MKNKILSAIILTFILSCAAFAQTFDKAKLDKFFDVLAEKNKSMGSMAIAKDGRVLYARAAGYSRIDGKDKKPSTVETRYRVGSITKTFTAVMIFQLVEEGKLKLTDTLDKFYPQVPNAGKITIAHLLHHSSGLHNFTSDKDYETWLMNPKTESEMLDIIARSKPDFEPGAQHRYSNSGYVLLGYIIEKVGKKPYQTALRERITEKLGLSDTYLGSGKVNPGKNEAFSYSFKNEWKPETDTDMSIPAGAGAIISTPTDLTKFIHALFELKLISKENLDRMMTFKNEYGMGIFPYPVGGKTFYGHTGGIDGFTSMLIYLPEEKLALAYISNGMDYSMSSVMLAAFEIYQNKPFQIPTFETVAVSPEILEKYTGVYAREGLPLKITVTRDGATLIAQATGQPSFPLEATSETSFKFDRAGIIMEFDAEKNQLTLKQNGREFVLTKEEK